MDLGTQSTAPEQPEHLVTVRAGNYKWGQAVNESS